MADLDVWYTKDDPATALATLADQISNRQSWRRSRLLHELRLYGDRAIAGLSPAAYTRSAGSAQRVEYEPGAKRISLNVVRSCVDAATSQLLQNTPRATYLTRGGDFSLRQQAKQRTKFAEGVMHSGDYYAGRRRAIKSVALFGTGAVKTLDRYGRVMYEPTFIGELLVDDYDGINQTPRQLIQQKVYDREVLRALYPAKAKKIRDEGLADQEYFGRDPLCDQVLVREAWHLPSKPGGSDGRHVICINSETLHSEKWNEEDFPFSFTRWSDEPLGFWGTGLGYELGGIQYEINQLLMMVQQNMYLGGNLKILVERGANIIKSHLSNSLRGTVIEYSGTAPVFATHDLVSNQILQHLWELVKNAYNITGISQLAASGVKPAGVDSGKAQLVYAHHTSQRFLTVAQNDEDAVRDAAKHGVAAARRIVERDGDLTVTLRNRNWMEQVSAKEALKGEDDDFHLQSHVTSILHRTPPGILKIAEQYVGAGMLDPTQAKKALEDMDLDAEMDLELAPSDLIDRRIELILEKGREGFVAPHPRMDLGLARKRATLAYARAELENADPDHLDLLGQWLDTIDDLEQRAEVAASAAAPAVPTTPGLPAPVPMPPIPPQPGQPGAAVAPELPIAV